MHVCMHYHHSIYKYIYHYHYYCIITYIQVMQDCPAGRYGAEARMATSDCSGPCHRGYYCPRGSTKSTEVSSL